MELGKIYIPKKDTQQTDFLEKYPKFDGRNTIIGIIDSGIVDISLPGMQTTTTGLPKVIDCFDFSNLGIVDTSLTYVTSAYATSITLPGLSGRKLNIPMHWKNPSKKWHIGKISYENLSFHYNMRECDENSFANTSAPGIREKKVDCIVWFDGEKWRASVDTSFSENLESIKVLTNFADEHEYSFLDAEKTISYCIKIEKNGNRLQILVSRFDHANSVALAAAAHFPNEPKSDGLAPGAQIISCSTLGNTKNDGFLIVKKALLKLLEIGSVDIINISLKIHDTPGIANIIEEMVEKHGIIIVKSAGNDGPSFKSIKTNLPFFNHLFVIGAVFTNEMNQKLRKAEDTDDCLPKVFFHSSKGPSTSTYARGVDFVAPGAVVIPSPRWCQGTSKLHAGTSFAAPIAAGSIACLISALKANSIHYSPSKIRLALATTALAPKNDNGLGFGNGIIQIKDAFKLFKNNLSNISSINLTTLKNTNTEKVGIYYIQQKSKLRCVKYQFKLNPISKEPIKWDLKIFSNSATKFVGHSEAIKDDNLLSIQIDPNSLIPGTLNYAEIRGYDSSNPSLGPLFHLPITVIFPQKVTKQENNCVKKIIALYPNSFYSYFLYPPYASTQCIFKFTVLEAVNAQLYFECNQIQISCSSIQFTPENMIQTLTIPIQWKRMQEIYVFWRPEFQNKNAPDVLRFNIDLTFTKKNS